MSISPNLQPPGSEGASPSTGPGSAGSSTGPATSPTAKTLEQALAGIFSPGGAEESSDIAALQQQADSILEEQGVTTQSLTQLQQKAEALINQPTLSEPDQLTVNLYLAKVLTLKIQMGLSGPTGGVIPAAGGNAYLDNVAIVELFVILSKIAIEMTKIKYSEAQLKVSLAKMTIEIAKEIATLILEMGDIAAQKCINQASEYMTEGTAALAEVVVGAATVVMTAQVTQEKTDEQIQGKMAEDYKTNSTNKFYDDWMKENQSGTETAISGKTLAQRTAEPPSLNSQFFKDHKNDPTFALNASEKSTIQYNTHQEVDLLMKPFSSLVTASKSFAQAALQLSKASLEKENSFMEAAKSQLQTLQDMVNKTSDTLGKDIDDIKGSLQKLFQMFEEIARVYAQLGSPR